MIGTERGFQSEAEGDKADACAPNHISLNGRDEQDKNEEHDRRWAVMLRWRLFRDRLMDSHLIDEILEVGFVRSAWKLFDSLNDRDIFCDLALKHL